MIKLLIHAKRVVSLFHPLRTYYPVEYARTLRSKSDKMISNIRADLDGCTDEWFLDVRNTLDKCVPADSPEEQKL